MSTTDEMIASTLVAHRWNPGGQTCMCMYGKQLPPLVTPRKWANHVVGVMKLKGYL